MSQKIPLLQPIQGGPSRGASATDDEHLNLFHSRGRGEQFRVNSCIGAQVEVAR